MEIKCSSIDEVAAETIHQRIVFSIIGVQKGEHQHRFFAVRIFDCNVSFRRLTSQRTRCCLKFGCWFALFGRHLCRWIDAKIMISKWSDTCCIKACQRFSFRTLLMCKCVKTTKESRCECLSSLEDMRKRINLIHSPINLDFRLSSLHSITIAHCTD